MYAVLVINIEAPLEDTFHYHVPSDLEPLLNVGHLVEVEFGRRLAQGIVIAFDKQAPVEETKPIINIIDPEPVLRPWQIELAWWMSKEYLTPMNACLRLMLPPGLTRWADITLEINPGWDGSGRLTEAQEALLQLLRERGDLRGRQISRVLPKELNWKAAANQLEKRKVLKKGSVLDPPRVRPKKIQNAELIASPKKILDAAMSLGRQNKLSDIVYWLLKQEDPLSPEIDLIKATGTGESHLKKLQGDGTILRIPAEPILILTDVGRQAMTDVGRQAMTDVGRQALTEELLPADQRIILEQLPAPRSSLPEGAAISLLKSEGLVDSIEGTAAVSLAVTPLEARSRIFKARAGEKYDAVLALLAHQAQPVPVQDICRETGASITHLRKLAKLDLIRFREEEVWRDPLADRDFVPDRPPELTEDQARAWERIRVSMVPPQFKPPNGSAGPANTTASSETDPFLEARENRPFLLHGVTGSGKTEIYLRAVEFALQVGQKAIILVPEIALTPQTVRRFAARFPGQVAILHSRLSDGERFDTWRRARQGQFDVVIGPRSALFTPLEPVGVIVIDEEHDHSYKQTAPVPSPYYHARDVAVKLSQITGGTLIMGSATPDLVIYHQTLSGKFNLLELPKRIMGHRQRIHGQAARLKKQSQYQKDLADPQDALSIPLPPVQLVDLRQELRAGNRSIFSRALKSALDETLARGEQAILFLNRRGTATFVMCRDCGHVLSCPRCDMPLTYHRPGAMLECHHCGRKERPQPTCPQCGSERIKYFGLGTEKVEELVRAHWPAARIVRWDRDTTGGKGSHEQILSSFINQEADVLVGTQMIAKGLDLPLVTLVGVISADVSLGLPDYRIGERTFQILAQVAGRAGRGLLGGRVIFQTYQPEHYAIQAAAQHDFTQFYLDEIRFRTQYSLPPFRRMAKLILADPIDQRAEQEARKLASSLELHKRDLSLAATELVGPVPPFFSRVGGLYRWQILVRSPNPHRLLKDFKLPPKWILELDPMSTL